MIAARADELALRYPDKKSMFEGYVKGQQCEVNLIHDDFSTLHGCCEKELDINIPDEKQLIIRLVTENKKEFLSLLLLGDEQESQIDKYLERGDLFALYNGDIKCVCVVTDEGNGTLEIQNLATDPRYWRQGYASRLIEYIAEHYAERYDKIILGTGDVPGILAFYNRRGFRETHRVAGYFTTHYDHPIIEDGVLLKDKVYLARKLGKQEVAKRWRRI